MRTHFTQSNERTPGTWKPTSTGGAVLVCPDCHQTLAIGPGVTAHTIQDGRVSPSVICTRPGCTFHAFITLG